MFLHRKRGRAPSLHRVTRGALARIGAFRKLAVMRILVAIHALGKCEWLLEISVGMALGALDACMFAFQRKLRLRVIETFVHRLQRNLFPSAGVVARLATLREAAVVRILVTVRALVERDTCILRLAVGSVGVTLR